VRAIVVSFGDQLPHVGVEQRFRIATRLPAIGKIQTPPRPDLLLLPPVAMGFSHEHADFKGTVRISSTTLHAIVTGVAISLEQACVTKLVIVNGQGATSSQRGAEIKRQRSSQQRGPSRLSGVS
jgi:creatinine amidohydrolase/Fe(II)-dependent formamide hydrolase-like protein